MGVTNFDEVDVDTLNVGGAVFSAETAEGAQGAAGPQGASVTGPQGASVQGPQGAPGPQGVHG